MPGYPLPVPSQRKTISPGPEQDGRVARRLRNREAVLDATYALVEAGNTQPSFEDVADASGVSFRSIYRYFSNRDDLMRAALAHRASKFDALFRISNLGEGDLNDRITTIVDQRLALWNAIGPAIPVLRRLAPSPASLRIQIDRRQLALRRELEAQFQAEFAAMDADRREAVFHAADILCQFEAIEYLRRRQRLTEDATRELLATALIVLLSSEPPRTPRSDPADEARKSGSSRAGLDQRRPLRAPASQSGAI